MAAANRFRNINTLEDLDDALHRLEEEGNVDPLVQMDERDRRREIISAQGMLNTLLFI